MAAATLVAAAMLPCLIAAGQPEGPGLKLMGNRFLTFSTLVRVRQIETTREAADGPDESSVHTPAEARVFRDAVEKGWPGARITRGFSWLALKDQRPNYPAPGQHSRNWSLLNRLNQKSVRPQDSPIPIRQMNADERALIERRYPELIKKQLE